MDSTPPPGPVGTASTRHAALVVGLGAFLLFLVEPLIARRLLPVFGGTAAVWTTCVLSFQVLLVAGYAAAHRLTRVEPGRRRAVQYGALGLAFVSLLVAPSPDFAAGLTDTPTLGVLAGVLLSVGLPYWVLSTTGPNVARILGGTPYRLYALSNAASLAALLAYPTLIEPMLTLSQQATLFLIGFGLQAVAVARLVRHDTTPSGEGGEPATSRTEASDPPTSGDPVDPERRPTRPVSRWLALSAVPSGLFLAVTNHLGTNLAPMPLLWVLPLGLYLLTLVLCFDHPRWYRRTWFVGLLPVALVFLGLSRTSLLVHGALWLQVAGASVALFIACMAAHGELARLRPAAEGITGFYLTIATGGALGGAFVAVLAPALFETTPEFPLLILATAIVVGHAWRRSPPEDFRVEKVFGAFLWLFVGLYTVIAGALELHTRVTNLACARSAYGALRVADIGTGEHAIRSLVSGTIRHGAHFTDPARRHRPATYYSATSGVGRVFKALRARASVGAPTASKPTATLSVGVVGLGTGSLADWLEPGDRARFYEIDPVVERLARRWFFALPEARATVDVVLGDARRRLAEAAPENFDLLAVDAFTSDAIPTHLLTREAFEIYRRHLAPGGVLAVHISNRFVSLLPVLAAEATAGGWAARVVFDPADLVEPLNFASRWVLLTERPDIFEAPDLTVAETISPSDALATPWTDDFAPLLGLLDWR